MSRHYSGRDHRRYRKESFGLSDFTTVHKRLFILGGGTEEEYREAFDKYGTIEDVWVVKDKKTGANKGITYVTMSKTSEACLAMEELNGQCLPGHTKPLKVLISADRERGNLRDDNENEKLLRIFVKIPKTHTTADVEKIFEQWGELDGVTVLTERISGAPKGLAYVRYNRAYCAARAIEECGKEYKAVFAAKRKMDQFTHFQPVEYRPEGRGGGGYGGDYGPIDMIGDVPHTGECRLEALLSSDCDSEQVYRLFDMIPGLEYCDFDRNSGIATVKYLQPQCASFAKERINGFEYPPGMRVSVRFPPNTQIDYRGGAGYGGGYDDMEAGGGGYGSSRSSRGRGGGGGSADIEEIASTLDSLSSDPSVQGNDVLQTLVKTVAKATTIIQKSGGVALGGGGSDGTVRTNYCNIPLPEKSAMAPRDSDVLERLFVVSQPSSFPDTIMRDLFCRFGTLIDAFFMPGKNYGYVKFADKDCGSNAIETLHGQEICGNRIKVMYAEPPRSGSGGDSESSNKRKK